MENQDTTSYSEQFNQLLNTPAEQPVDANTLARLCDRFPSFILPLIIQLRHPHPELDEATISKIISHIALSLPDPTRLRVLIDPEGTGRYDNFYPKPQVDHTPSTTDAIDTFLSNYGNISPQEEELLNKMIFNPVPDYASTLQMETPVATEPADDQDRLIDAFLNTAPAPATQQPKPETPKAPSGSLLSESLAKIFIKQHNYKRAYEIIRSLSLNYPEKSIYFADQMRFLRKLIQNQEAQERLSKEKNK